MKKSRILVPALAVLALGVAGSAVGTVAWFQSTGVAQIDVENDVGGINAKESSLDVGSFKVTPIVNNSYDAVELTNTEGKTFVYVNGTRVEAKLSDGYREIVVGLKVEYTAGSTTPITDDGQIKDLWITSLQSKGVSVTASSSYDKVRFLAGVPSGSTGWADASESGANVLTKSFADLTGDSITFSGGSFTLDNIGSVYVAITGVDDAANPETGSTTQANLTFAAALA